MPKPPYQSDPSSMQVILEDVLHTQSTPILIWPDPPAPENQFGRIPDHAACQHYHYDLELGVCYQGSGQFHVGSRTIAFQAPCASILYPGEAHSMQSSPEQPSHWYIVHVARSACNIKAPFHNTFPVIEQVTQEHSDIMTLISMLIRSVQETKGGDHANAISLLQVILQKHRKINGDSEFREEQFFLDEIAPALAYLSSHYQEPCPLEKLSELCSMSIPTLRRKFVQAVNLPPNDYLHHLRIRNAVSLLKDTGMSVLEIANEVGYPSISSFNRQFLKIMKTSPSEIRKSRNAPPK